MADMFQESPSVGNVQVVPVQLGALGEFGTRAFANNEVRLSVKVFHFR